MERSHSSLAPALQTGKRGAFAPIERSRAGKLSIRHRKVIPHGPGAAYFVPCHPGLGGSRLELGTRNGTAAHPIGPWTSENAGTTPDRENPGQKSAVGSAADKAIEPSENGAHPGCVQWRDGVDPPQKSGLRATAPSRRSPECGFVHNMSCCYNCRPITPGCQVRGRRLRRAWQPRTHHGTPPV